MQKELFSSTVSPMPRITLELSGLGPVPSFKTGKKAIGWLDPKSVVTMVHGGEIWIKKRGLRIMVRPMTLPEHQEWMEKAISLIESRLRSAFQTIGVVIPMAASARSLIASLVPLDDCWTSYREVVIKSELCAPGQEGATITIERL